MSNIDEAVLGQTFWALFGLFLNLIQREIDYYTSRDRFFVYTNHVHGNFELTMSSVIFTQTLIKCIARQR
eukprot:UN02854